MYLKIGYDYEIEKHSEEIPIRKQEKLNIKFAISEGKTFIAGPLF